MPKKVKTTVEFEGTVREILVDVPDVETPVWGQDAALSIVGHRTPRVDAMEKVTGRAKYTSDLALPGMLYAKILRSPHPHAKVKAIDTSIAEKLPGVKAVVHAFNTEPIPWHGTSFVFDKTVRLVGDEVGAVAAVDEETANEAIKLIKVEYEKLLFVLEAEEALKPDAPKIWERGNLLGGRPSIYQRGDVEKGFAEADLVVEETFRTQVELHSCLETHGSVVMWEGDNLTVWDSTQGIFAVREAVAGALKLPVHKVRVIKQYMGGGFGSKLEAGKYTVIAALLARKARRPVKLMLARDEEQMNTGNRPSSVQYVKAGVKKDGTLTALYLKSVNPCGAYTGGAGCGAPYREMYKCPNVKTEEYAVYINAGRTRPTRAPGHVQGTFGLESMMDMLAEKIGMNPLEFRKKNYVEVNQAMAQPKPYSSKALHGCYEEGAKKIGWEQRKQRAVLAEPNGQKVRGLGMASQIWGGGGGPPAYAMVKINSDGTVNLITGTQDIGGGTKTIACMICAEELGVPLSDVKISMGDTETCPFTGSSGGSITAPSVGPAVRVAAADAKNQLLEYASVEFKANVEDIAIKNGKVFVKSKPETALTLRQLMQRSRATMIVGKGFRGPNPSDYSLNTFGAHFAEVEVDTATGQVKVLRVVAAHDSGRAFNPLTFEGQIEGGVIQGIGFGLTEERVLNRETGTPVNPNLLDYKIVTAPDIPPIDTIIIHKVDPYCNNLGGRGIGEPPRIPTAAAIANAIYNAIGVRITDLPITPNKVLMALKNKSSPPRAASAASGLRSLQERRAES